MSKYQSQKVNMHNEELEYRKAMRICRENHFGYSQGLS